MVYAKGRSKAGSMVRRKAARRKMRSRGWKVSKQSRPTAGSTVSTESRQFATRRFRVRGPAGARRFANRVNTALMLAQPLQTYQSVQKAIATASGGFQAIRGCMLLTVGETKTQDLFNIFKDAFSLAVLPANALNRKIYIRSAYMSMTINNLDSTPAQVDVYEIICRKSLGINYLSIEDNFGNDFIEQRSIGLSIDQDVNVTPFSNPNFLHNWKVVKKTSLLLKQNEATKLEMPVKVNRYIDGNLLLESQGGLAGLTRGYIVFSKGVATNNAAASGTGPSNVAISANSSFTYAVPASESQETIGQTK